MKTIMLAAPSSGGGKTTIAMGVIRALKNRGLGVCAFKTGPDYIDRAFLESASGKPAGNLDLHLQGKEGLQYALSLANSDHCVIEGVMGYFDGIANTWKNSSCHIADQLKIPTVLIYTPKGEMFSAIPKIKGMADFAPSSIQLVIFNKVTAPMYLLLKEALESHTSLKAIGYLPPMKDVEIPSRHLGLVQSQEIDALDQLIESIAQSVEAHIDLETFIAEMTEISPEIDLQRNPIEPRKPITVAIARDQAFSFYYRENLQLLEEQTRVEYFSPLHDTKLPSCDLVYLGGGYPEVFRKELADNVSMRQSIKEYGENGGAIYAECGGYMYLGKAIEDSEMVGLFQGVSHLTSKLQRFGYIDIELKQDCLLGKAGDRLTGHEFHKSITIPDGSTRFTIHKTGKDKKWECGYSYKNVLAGYPHISFAGNQKVLQSILNQVNHQSGE